MKKIFVLPFIVLSMLASCSGSTTKENDSNSYVDSKITTCIESGIQKDNLSSINLGLSRILLHKKFLRSLEESDKFVELSKDVVKKYRERINKLIEKSDKEEEKERAKELLKEIDNL